MKVLTVQEIQLSTRRAVLHRHPWRSPFELPRPRRCSGHRGRRGEVRRPGEGRPPSWRPGLPEGMPFLRAFLPPPSPSEPPGRLPAYLHPQLAAGPVWGAMSGGGGRGHRAPARAAAVRSGRRPAARGVPAAFRGLVPPRRSCPPRPAPAASTPLGGHPGGEGWGRGRRDASGSRVWPRRRSASGTSHVPRGATPTGPAGPGRCPGGPARTATPPLRCGPPPPHSELVPTGPGMSAGSSRRPGRAALRLPPGRRRPPAAGFPSHPVRAPLRRPPGQHHVHPRSDAALLAATWATPGSVPPRPAPPPPPTGRPLRPALSRLQRPGRHRRGVLCPSPKSADLPRAERFSSSVPART
jgi:hypothetical protein